MGVKVNPEQQLRYLEMELTKSRTENTELRKRLQENSRHAKRVNQAYQDALLLAMWYTGGITPSRRYAALHNISQNKYENAMALLKMARVVVRQRHWHPFPLEEIERRLESARQRALNDRELFRLRLNAHARGVAL